MTGTVSELASALLAHTCSCGRCGQRTPAYIRDAASMLTRQQALLDEAAEDKARLDWLDAINLRMNERNGSVYGWRYDINHNRAALTDHNLPALTIREAIDCARFPDRAGEICSASAKEGARRKAFDERFSGLREQARATLTKIKESRDA